MHHMHRSKVFGLSLPASINSTGVRNSVLNFVIRPVLILVTSLVLILAVAQSLWRVGVNFVSYFATEINTSLAPLNVKVEGVSASYTSGGMTVAVKTVEATNVDYSSTAANNDNEMWKVSLSFAF